jgi:hypothetical protein
VGLEEHRIEQVDERHVEEVDPHRRFRPRVPVPVPGPTRGEQHIPGEHRHLHTVDDGVGALIGFQHQPAGMGRVAVGAGALARKD